MIFDTLHIENFRGISIADITGFRRVNLFFGKNNCGKSSVLEALFLISGLSNPTLPIAINSMRSFHDHSESSMSLDFYNLDTDRHIMISATGKEYRSLDISLIKSNNSRVDLLELAKMATEDPTKAYGLKLKFSTGDGKSYSSEVVLRENENNAKVNVDKRYDEKLFSMYLTARMPQSESVDQFKKIVENKQEGEILEVLRKIEPRIKDLQLVGDTLMADIGAAQRLPINMMGDGLRKMAAIILDIYRSKDGILLIDEIDNGFHFSSMKTLWKAIMTAAVHNNVQIFASTHNIDSIKGLSAVLKESELTEHQSDVAAFNIMRNSDGKVLSLNYDYKTLDYSITQEMEVR